MQDKIIEQPNSYANYGYSYQNPANMQMNSSFIEHRLSNKELLKQVEYYLSANRKKLIRDKETNEFYEEYVNVGKPLANEEGINHIMHILSMRTNTGVVLGNFTDEHYWNFLKSNREEISEEIILNCYEWGIEDSKINEIIDTIMSFLEPFLSRLIDNEERNSLMQQLVSREVVMQPNKKGINDHLNLIK